MAFILLCLTIILSPLYILRLYIPIWGLNFLIPTTLLELLILLTICLSCFEFIRKRDKISEFKTRFDLIILGLLFVSTVETLLSNDLVGGLGILKAYFIEPIIFYYLLLYQIRKRGINFILYSLLGSACWLSLLALLQKLTGSFTLAPNEIILGRVTAVYNSANSLALYIGPVILIALIFFVQSKKFTRKILFFCLFIFYLIVLIWTKSRGGLIAELGSLIIFGYTIIALKRKLLRTFWFVIPLALAFVISLFLYQVYLEYNFIPIEYGQPNPTADTLQIRYFIWTGTINLLKDHPILGAGLNGFKKLYSNQYRLSQYQEQFQYPHNFILTVWTELGLFGLFIFLYLIISTYGFILRNLRKSKDSLLGVGYIAMLSYWMIHGVVDVPYFKNDLSIEFWTVIALITHWS